MVLCCLGLSSVTNPNTFIPRVIKFCVANTSAVFEPRTSVTATTSFAGFLNDTALWTYRILAVGAASYYLIFLTIADPLALLARVAIEPLFALRAFGIRAIGIARDHARIRIAVGDSRA